MTGRRHSFPNDGYRRLSSSRVTRPPPPPQRRRKRRAEWRWDRMLIMPVATCVQVVLLLLAVLVLTGFWAYTFMKLPEPVIVYDPADQAVALAAWSELTQSLLSMLVYKFQKPLVLKEMINLADYSNSKCMLSMDVADFLPEGRYARALIEPFVIIPTAFDPVEDLFTIDLDVLFPFAQLVGRAIPNIVLLRSQKFPFHLKPGTKANVTVVLKLPADRYQYQWRLQELQMFSKRINLVVNGVLQLMFRGFKPLVPNVTQSEVALMNYERLLSVCERYRGRTAWVTKHIDPRPVKAHVLDGFRRPMAIPRKIAAMSATDRTRSLNCYTMLLQHLLYTFLFNPENQDNLRKSLARITRSMSGPIRVRIMKFNMGINSWRDVPVFWMLNTPDEPYTYRMGFRANYSNFRIQLAVDGINNSSSIVLNICNLTINGTMDVGVDHPLAVNLDEQWPVDYITVSLHQNPACDFNVTVSHEDSHFFGTRLNRYFHDLFEDYLAKGFVKRFVTFFLSVTLVNPNRVRVPWLIDPTALLFDSQTVQTAYEWIRRIFISVQYKPTPGDL